MAKQTNRTVILGLIIIGVLVLVLVASLSSRDTQSGSVTIDTPVVRLGDKPVAKVNGTTIFLSDVNNLAVTQGKIGSTDRLSPGDTLFETTLSELIDQRLMALEASSMGLDAQDGARRRLAQARERILGNVLVEEHLKTTVTEEAARKIYDAQASIRNRGSEVRARHILVADKELADIVMQQIEKGEGFPALASAYSTDRATRDNGGDLGYFTFDMFDPEFSRFAFETPTGQVAGPFQTALGWHILRVIDKRQAREPTFEETRQEIMTVMTYDEIDKLVKRLRSEGTIERLEVQGASPSAEPDNE